MRGEGERVFWMLGAIKIGKFRIRGKVILNIKMLRREGILKVKVRVDFMKGVVDLGMYLWIVNKRKVVIDISYIVRKVVR